MNKKKCAIVLAWLSYKYNNFFTDFVAKKAKVYRRRMAMATDRRLKNLTEIIKGILVIKLHVWEDIFCSEIEKTREEELNALTFSNRIRVVILCSTFFVERVLLFVGIVVYVIWHHTITADIVFYLAQLCHLSYLTISLYMMLALFETSECFTTMKRVEEFLLLDERRLNVTNASKNGVIAIENVVLQKQNRLSLNIEPGAFCAIIGPVGSGEKFFKSYLKIKLKSL